MAGEDVGTRFVPRDSGLGSFTLWLLHGKPSRGRLVVDAGAARAVRGKASLLPVGVTAVEGPFAAGDAVVVVDAGGTELAKGIVNYSSEELDQLKGLRTDQAGEQLVSEEAIHRDYLVLVE